MRDQADRGRSGAMKSALALAFSLGLAACSNALGRDSAEDAYRRGVEALDGKEPRTARIEFLNAIKADPANGLYRIAQARTYLALGDGGAAESEIIQARRLGGAAAETRHLMARAYSLQSRDQEALAEAEAAPPEYRAGLAGIRGRSLAALGEQRLARAEFQKALAANLDDGLVWADIARLRRSDGDAPGAILAADRAVRLDPRNVSAFLLRGDLADRYETDLAALYWYNRALAIDPDHLEARLKRLEALRQIGEYQAMLAEARNILKLSEEEPAAYYFQARIAAEAGNFALARKLYQLTNGRLDHEPRVMLLASAIDYHLGNTEHALQRLKRIVAMRPKYRKARRLLAASYWRVGDAEAVARTLRPLTRLDKPDRFALTLMARARAELGDDDAAVRYLEEAAQAAAAERRRKDPSRGAAARSVESGE